MKQLISILGPTATGKTQVATELAYQTKGEIISADSRQVYKGMDIGTGKDLSDYHIHRQDIPYHLIDILEAGEEYNLFRFMQDFHHVFKSINQRNKQGILCGGTGLYIHSILKGYQIKQVDIDKKLRTELADKTKEELIELLKSKTNLHNTTDIESRPRLIRALEIALNGNDYTTKEYQAVPSHVFGIQYPRETVRQRITERLHQRMEEGMIEEVQRLMDSGVSSESLIWYGLEYKFITRHLLGEISYTELFNKLNIAIHQFSKRQMTWFRKMEKEGIHIQWIDGNLSLDDKIHYILERI